MEPKKKSKSKNTAGQRESRHSPRAGQETPEEWISSIEQYRRKLNASYGRDDSKLPESGTASEPDDEWVKNLFLYAVHDGHIFRMSLADTLNILEVKFPQFSDLMKIYKNNMPLRVARALADYSTQAPRRWIRKGWAELTSNIHKKATTEIKAGNKFVEALIRGLEKKESTEDDIK